MKQIAIAVPLLLLAGEASAISRYDIGNMSCGKVQAILRSEGAAILRYRSKRTGNVLYDRYVLNRSWCPSNQTTEYAGVPTADDPSCDVKRCVEIEFFDRF
jgi:hypothetical protein